MSVMVRFGRRTAILRAGRWLASEPDLECDLNEHTAQWFRSGLAPRPGDDEELAVAQEIARHFEGRLVNHVKTRKGAGKQFLSQRQLGFDY
jgi:hypothetical protein